MSPSAYFTEVWQTQGCKACVWAADSKKPLIPLLGTHTEVTHVQAPAGCFLASQKQEIKPEEDEMNMMFCTMFLKVAMKILRASCSMLIPPWLCPLEGKCQVERV